jgi:pimeloyl-ACP methyl ester carboxylesterase
VKPAIETREAITVGACGARLRGTYHKPQGEKADSPLDTDEKKRIGFLFLSAGVSPRAAPGDSAVYWANAYAKCGYPCFRFDLPGLGDSDCEPVTGAIDFDAMVADGYYSPAVCELTNELVERFHLGGVVIIGHCAGAVTALYAAAVNQRIKGLVLLDPYFHVQEANNTQTVLARSHSRIVGKLVGDGPAPAILRSAGVSLLSCARAIYHRIEPIRRLVRRKKLPGTANLPLIRCWEQLATAGLPMLVLRCAWYTPKPGEFDYVHDLHPLSDRHCRTSVKLIEGTMHSFEERRAKEAVLKHTEQWLSAFFPLTRCTEARNAEHHSQELADATTEINANVC